MGGDEVTSASMRTDRRRADEWRHAWGVPAPRTSVRADALPLPPGEQGRYPFQAQSPDQQHGEAGQAGGQAFPPRFGPDFNARSAEWAAFWDAVGVVPAEVPNLQTRLSYLFGLASAWGFLKVRCRPSLGPKWLNQHMVNGLDLGDLRRRTKSMHHLGHAPHVHKCPEPCCSIMISAARQLAAQSFSCSSSFFRGTCPCFAGALLLCAPHALCYTRMNGLGIRAWPLGDGAGGGVRL